MRLRNIPQNASLRVTIEVSGDTGIALVDSKGYEKYPAVDRPLFQGRTGKKISFSVIAPATDHYYIIFDNRSGRDSRQIKVAVTASRGARPPPERTNGNEGSAQVSLKAAAKDIKDLGKKLNRIFVLKHFPIRFRKCGKAGAFATSSQVLFCREYAQKLHQVLGDEKKVSDAIVFTILHEVGDAMLAQWKYPFYDNEEVVDEFATVVLVMLGQKDRVRAKAEFFATHPAVVEALAKARKDDRHPLSVQRARNILRWANDPNLLRKWQKVFVPHMRSALLEQLRRNPKSWTDRKLVEKELAARR